MGGEGRPPADFATFLVSPTWVAFEWQSSGTWLCPRRTCAVTEGLDFQLLLWDKLFILYRLSESGWFPRHEGVQIQHHQKKTIHCTRQCSSQ